MFVFYLSIVDQLLVITAVAVSWISAKLRTIACKCVSTSIFKLHTIRITYRTILTGFMQIEVVVEKEGLAILKCGYHNGTGWYHAQHSWQDTNVKAPYTLLTINHAYAWNNRRLFGWTSCSGRGGCRCIGATFSMTRWIRVKHILPKLNLCMRCHQIEWHCHQRSQLKW